MPGSSAACIALTSANRADASSGERLTACCAASTASRAALPLQDIGQMQMQPDIAGPHFDHRPQQGFGKIGQVRIGQKARHVARRMGLIISLRRAGADFI